MELLLPLLQLLCLLEGQTTSDSERAHGACKLLLLLPMLLLRLP